MAEMDMTANQQGTTVKDQNGQVCALIKIETTQTGFSFDVGSLGVTETVQKLGKIWVYVPAGVRKITISHPQLGVLCDYAIRSSQLVHEGRRAWGCICSIVLR